MAITQTNILATPHEANNVNIASPTSWTMDIDASADLVVVLFGSGADTKGVTSIVVDPSGASASMSKAVETDGGPRTQAEIWYLVNPPTGTGVTFELTVDTDSTELVAKSIAYSGVDTGNPVVGTAASWNNAEADTSASNSVSSASDALVIDILTLVGDETATLDSDAGQTNKMVEDFEFTDLSSAGGSVADSPGASSTTMGWSWTNAQRWAHALASFRAGATEVTLTLPTAL